MIYLNSNPAISLNKENDGQKKNLTGLPLLFEQESLAD